MARIAGVDVPNNKQSYIGLTYIFGVGNTVALEVLKKCNIPNLKKIGELNEDELSEIRKVLEDDYTIEGALRSERSMNIKRLIDIGAYRGLRHRRGLPCRGQNTKNNARTRKGPRKTIAGKKK